MHVVLILFNLWRLQIKVYVEEMSTLQSLEFRGCRFVDSAVCFQGMKGKIDEYSDSDEDKHDAYLERMKAEGKIREEGNDSDESDGESGEKASFHCSGGESWSVLEDQF